MKAKLVSLSPNMKRIAFCYMDEQVVAGNTSNGKNVILKKGNDGFEVKIMKWSWDERFLIVSYIKGSISVVDFYDFLLLDSQGVNRFNSLNYENIVKDIAWKPNMLGLAVILRDIPKLDLFDVDFSGNVKHQTALKINTKVGEVKGGGCLAWNPVNANQLAIGGAKGIVEVLYFNGGNSQMAGLDIAPKDKYTNLIQHLKWSPNGKYIGCVDTNGNGFLRLWDIEQKKFLHEIKVCDLPIDAIEFEDMFNEGIVTADRKGDVKVWDIKKGQLIKSFSTSKRIKALRFFNKEIYYIDNFGEVTKLGL